MTRHPSPIHAKPVDAAGHHVPSESCSCGVVLAVDMTEPGRVVYVHRHAPVVPDPPPDADRLIWHSRERIEAHPQGRGPAMGSAPQTETRVVILHESALAVTAAPRNE